MRDVSDLPQKAAKPYDRGLSKRIYHAPPFMMPNWWFLINSVSYMRSRGYTHVLLNPFTTPTFEPNGDKPGGSPYAFADSRMNKRNTDGIQLSVQETIEANWDLVDNLDFVEGPDEEPMRVIYDGAFNHVGHKPNISKDDPVWRTFAIDEEKGIITFDELFCAPDEKRHPHISGDWTDVRELRMSNEKEIDNAIKYFAKPLIEYLALCGRPYGRDLPVNIRLDAPHMLPPLFWKKFAPIMIEVLSSKSGEKPLIILETIDKLEDYKEVYEAFPEDARPSISHLNYESHFAIISNTDHPYHQLYQIQTDNEVHKEWGYWPGIHNKKLTRNGISIINCTHDATDDNGMSMNARLAKHNLSEYDFVIARRLYNTFSQLSSKDIVRMHCDDVNDHHNQRDLFLAKPINPADVTSESAYNFSKDLNTTHKYLHDHKSYAWYEGAHVWGHKECVMHIAHTEAGFEGDAVATFVNASNDIVNKPGKEFVDLVDRAYWDKARINAYEGGSEIKNPNALKRPQEVMLLGQFSNDQIACLVERYGVITINGNRVAHLQTYFAENAKGAGGLTGTYGQAALSPDVPRYNM